MTRVLYNDQCPVCSLEIEHYKKYSLSEGIPVTYEDLNTTNLHKWGLSKDQAMRKLHVIKNRQLFVGVDAFIELWNDLPKYEKLSRFISHKYVYSIASFVYDRILAPILYNWNKFKK